MTTGISGPRALPALPQTRDAELSLQQLAPWIHKYAAQYGVDPMKIAGVVAQESSFINHDVHRDGTGHGLVGLDDKGLLPDFERWSGLRVGRGRQARVIAPEKQIEFLARTLANFTERFGDDWSAVRAWHAGAGGRNRPHAREYEGLIRGRFDEVAQVILATRASAEPPEVVASADSSFDASAGGAGRRAPVRLDPAAGAPVRGGLDYENG